MHDSFSEIATKSAPQTGVHPLVDPPTYQINPVTGPFASLFRASM